LHAFLESIYSRLTHPRTKRPVAKFTEASVDCSGERRGLFLVYKEMLAVAKKAEKN
jgi:hypothetical protein